MESPPIYFVLPENNHLPTGGNIYNAGLSKALQNQGKVVFSIGWDKFRDLWERNVPGEYWMDTLLLDCLRNFNPGNQNPSLSLNLIIHGLSSLFEEDVNQSTRIFKNNEKPLLLLFDRILVTSEFVGEYLTKRGVPTSSIMVIPPPLGIQPEAVNRSYSEKEVFKILLVGNLVPEKGVLPFLQILSKNINPEDHFQLTIIGRDDLNPDYSRKCKAEIEKNILLQERVEVRKPVSLNKMSEIYRGHHLFVAASFMETFGMALQEAKFSGLPMLGLNVGNVPQHIKNGVNGYLCDDLNVLVKQILDLLYVPENYNKLAASTWENLPTNHFSWEEAAQCFLQAASQN